jgi:hypothetical protein
MERRKVTMTNAVALPGGGTALHEAVDYVAVDHLEAYVADANERWQAVSVGDEEDHGPGGEKGEYTVHPSVKGKK